MSPCAVRLTDQDPESLDEALQADGFVITPGMAYMPVGVKDDALFAFRDDALLQAYESLRWPDGLECVLVAEGADGLCGRSMRRGKGADPVTDALKRVLDHLRDLEFEVREGSVEPFGEKLPLIAGAVWDRQMAQIALIAEAEGPLDDEVWRQLLFAVAGLRYHLAGDGQAALGSPLILAIVDEDGERELRRVVEDMIRQYALFNRVDLNFVARADVGDKAKLDDALAPLLPRCRAALDKKVEISKGEVIEFWQALRERIEETAEGLDEMFGDFRRAAGSRIADALVEGLDQSQDLPAIAPLHALRLRNFRSFAKEKVSLAPVTVVHGANGSGKSALLEGMEMLWAGTSQRSSLGVEAREYERHLRRGGDGEFEVANGGPAITSVADSFQAETVRCVLTQDAVANLANQAPGARYEQFLAITGLEIPELDRRTKRVLDSAKKDVDTVFALAGLKPLKSSAANGANHLRKALGGNFTERLPSVKELAGLEGLLADRSGGAFAARKWKGEGEALAAAEGADETLASMPDDSDVSPALDAAVRVFKELSSARHEVASAMRKLLEAMPVPEPQREEPSGKQKGKETPPISPRIAARWLSHGRSLSGAAADFKEESTEIEDAGWAKRLLSYAESLESIAEQVPQRELEKFTPSHYVPEALDRPVRVPKSLYHEAGFAEPPVSDPAELIPVIEEYVDLLRAQAGVIDALVLELLSHPARQSPERSAEVLGALCGYEVARLVRRKGPVVSASEDLVGRLLRGRLAPVVRELLSAFVRFEWYFEPLLIPDGDREIVLGGVATKRADLDARLTLNSAERGILGLSWFLALHLLQPEDRRRVLALDDVSAAFDDSNRAGFAATLRAFVRLTRPEQVLVISHDDGLARLLAEELAPVDGWPEEVKRLRCRRDENDASIVVEEEENERSVGMQGEMEQLGLGGEKAAAS